MKKKTILFDLDGTLLPMDQDAFTRGYFKLLAQKLAPHGYDPAALVDNIWAGTAAMVGNDGKRTNEAAFWDRFAALYGEQVREDIPLFEAFYRGEGSRNRQTGGSGLGLYLVKRILEYHCGEIRIRNTAAGVCVEVWLPRTNSTETTTSC